MSFRSLYLPIGVGTFHLESAKALFDASCVMLRTIDDAVETPQEMLLSVSHVCQRGIYQRGAAPF